MSSSNPFSSDPARNFFGAHPDPPRRGIVSSAFRLLIRGVLFLAIVLMDLGRRFGSILLRTEYKLAGQCKKRGACCHHVLLEWSPLFEKYPALGRLVLWKYTRIYSFFDRGYTWEIQDGLMTRVLGCHALQEDGSCGEYLTRPLICRAFPELPLTGRPLLLKGCGYKFERRDGKDMQIVESGEELVQIGNARKPRRLE